MTCPANCVVKHSNEKSCEMRHIQCPFVTCLEKIQFKNLIDHLWDSHKLLQFATESQIGSFNFGEKSFAQNFAARPFCMTFEGKQFVLEICRKQNTGLWHFWVFLVGSPWESHFYSCEIKIIGKNNKEEICYKGPVVSIDLSFSEVFRRTESLVVPDGVLKRFCDLQTMSVSYQVDLKLVEYQSYEDLFAHAREMDAYNSQWATASVSNSGDCANQRTTTLPAQPEVKSTIAVAQQPRQTLGIASKYGKTYYPDTHKLFVGNLFSECKDDLIQLFSPYGEIADVLFFRNSLNIKKFPFYAFVIFKQEKSVILVCQNKPIYMPDGQQLIVQTKIDGPVLKKIAPSDP